jgi:3-dehydroquinate synthase
MPGVNLSLPDGGYAIDIETGLLAELGERVRQVAPHEKAAVLVDEHVEPVHGRQAARSMQAAGFSTRVAVVPSGEDNKTLGTYRRLLEVLLEHRLERGSPVVALGGGMTGDTAGFAAATYLRGVPLIQSPTTLLAMVDASVGGKTGVNMPQGKNLVGSFYQPHWVAIDPDTLDTLPEGELRNGLAECIKHGMIRDAELFTWIEQNLEPILALDKPTLTELVQRNVQIKAKVVTEDEREAGVRAHLNFGHTFAHAIEACTQYSVYRHGEAVALGMIAATRFAIDAGRCEAQVLERLTTLLQRAGLPTHAPDLPASVGLIKAMGADKKVKDGQIRLILPNRIGEVTIAGQDTIQPLIDAFDYLRQS